MAPAAPAHGRDPAGVLTGTREGYEQGEHRPLGGYVASLTTFAAAGVPGEAHSGVEPGERPACNAPMASPRRRRNAPRR